MITRKEDAVFDSYQEKILDAIEFFTTGYTITATRGHSSPLEQLRIVEFYARYDGVLLKPFVHDNLYDMAEVDGKRVYLWQPTWSMLLHLYSKTNGEKGKLINPPLAAECLDDYWRGGVNKKGMLINPSPHISGGRSGEWPIDFSGKIKLSDGSEMVSLDIVADICHQAQLSGVAISNITKEIANNCVHIDLAKEAA